MEEEYYQFQYPFRTEDEVDARARRPDLPNNRRPR